jgi:hypothetical protein
MKSIDQRSPRPVGVGSGSRSPRLVRFRRRGRTCKAGVSIDTVDALMIRDNAFPRHERVQPTIAVARTFGGVRLQPREQQGIVNTTVVPITPGRRTQPDQAARSP